MNEPAGPAKDTFLFRIEDGVGIVTLNRPERLNAVTWEMAAGLERLFHRLRDDDDVRVVLLTGAGRAFCAGGDAEFVSGKSDRPLPGLSGDAPIARHQRKTPAGPFAGLTQAIVSVDKPVIGALHGHAVGAGLAYALACDRRFADATAKLCAIFVRRGLSPDCGVTWLLPRVTSLPTALMLVETAKMVDAQEALRLGLVDELVPEGQDVAAALAYAKEMAQGPSVAIDLARRCVLKSLNATLEEILDYEAVAGTMTSSTADAREGMLSMLEKRKGAFRGY